MTKENQYSELVTSCYDCCRDLSDSSYFELGGVTSGKEAMAKAISAIACRLRDNSEKILSFLHKLLPKFCPEKIWDTKNLNFENAEMLEFDKQLEKCFSDFKSPLAEYKPSLEKTQAAFKEQFVVLTHKFNNDCSNLKNVSLQSARSDAYDLFFQSNRVRYKPPQGSQNM